MRAHLVILLAAMLVWSPMAQTALACCLPQDEAPTPVAANVPAASAVHTGCHDQPAAVAQPVMDAPDTADAGTTPVGMESGCAQGLACAGAATLQAITLSLAMQSPRQCLVFGPPVGPRVGVVADHDRPPSLT